MSTIEKKEIVSSFLVLVKYLAVFPLKTTYIFTPTAPSSPKLVACQILKTDYYSA